MNTTITKPEVTGFINHQALGESGDKITVAVGDIDLVGTLHELAVFSGQLTALLSKVAEARAHAALEAVDRGRQQPVPCRSLRHNFPRPMTFNDDALCDDCRDRRAKDQRYRDSVARQDAQLSAIKDAEYGERFAAAEA